MKKVKIIMNSGKEYIHESIKKDIFIRDCLGLFFDEKGNPRDSIVSLKQDNDEIKLAINPRAISSLEQL
ncbi:hypothetical protein [Clostridium sporogenes]|uniref:hypothetical protein n=1 Tax=Clostridium sporogenes TaxID=1509 RepID=UPI0013D3F7B2|nr:hypothetical protein [Clostridium sporogenes]NFF75900.1 hypothetical protein [Clostridium sporogenes]NFH40789.1 hypothetical protein [Clostridium sporogenes]